MNTKKDRLRGHADGLKTKMKGTTMDYSMKKPIAQEVIEYGHFKAEVKMFSSSDIKISLTMLEPFETTRYDEYLDRTRWREQIANELCLLDWYVGDFVSANTKIVRRMPDAVRA